MRSFDYVNLVCRERGVAPPPTNDPPLPPRVRAPPPPRVETPASPPPEKCASPDEEAPLSPPPEAHASSDEEAPLSPPAEGRPASDEEETPSWEDVKMGYGNTALEEGYRAFVAMLCAPMSPPEK